MIESEPNLRVASSAADVTGDGRHPGGAARATSGRERRSVTAHRPRLLTRLGLAIVHPRMALAAAADRRDAGRAGSDLIAAIALVLAATQLRGLATAVWLGSSV